MRKLINALLGATALAGVALSAAPAHAGHTRWETTSRGWEIDAYDSAKGNTCAAYRPYDDGYSFMIGWRRNNDGTNYGGFRFTLIRKSWGASIKHDQPYTIRIVTDGRSWPAMDFIGSNHGNGSAGLLSADLVDMDFLKALALSNTVHFYQGDKHIAGLQLDGSQEAISKVLECQKAQDAKLRQAPTQSSNADKSWSVPIVRHGTNITIDGKVNDSEAINFTVDTGATVVSITREQAQRLGLKPHRQVSVEYADGRKGVEDVVMIDKLSVGGMVFVRNVEATVSDGSALLGKNFLDKFGSYEIDNRQAKLILRN